MSLVMQPGRPTAELIDVTLDVRVDLLGQHARHNLKCRIIGITTSLNESSRQSGLLHRHGDRLSAAVNHDRPHSHRLHEHDVNQQGS